MLRTKLKIEPETELGLYLGCNLSKGQAKLYDGTSVATMTYDMEGLLKLSVEKYLDIVGKDTKLKIVSTPSLPDETKQHKSRTPTPGDPKKSVSCPWCSHKFDPAYLVNGEFRDRREGRQLSGCSAWGISTSCCKHVDEATLCGKDRKV